MGEPSDLFQSYGDVLDFIKDYYITYRAVPPVEEVERKFPSVELPPTDIPTDYHLSELKSNFVRVSTDKVIEAIAQALDHGEAPSLVLEKGLASFTKLTRYTSSSIDVNITDYESALEYYNKERIKSLEEGVSGIPTGIAAIDANYPTGLAPGQSVIVMGYSASGKSWVTAYMAIKAWLSGRRVMVVSLELSAEEYRDRLYSVMSEGRFRGSELTRGEINDEDFLDWAKAKMANAADFIIVETGGVGGTMTPNKVQAKIDTHKPDLVILDYLQLMSDNDHEKSMVQRMLNLSRQIKLMAMSNKIPIISITSVTDEDGGKREGPPRISQIAWSRGIEFDASLVLSVFKHGNVIEVVSRKNRYGDDFAFYYAVDFDRGEWTELFETPEGLRQ